MQSAREANGSQTLPLRAGSDWTEADCIHNTTTLALPRGSATTPTCYPNDTHDKIPACPATIAKRQGVVFVLLNGARGRNRTTDTRIFNWSVDPRALSQDRSTCNVAD